MTPELKSELSRINGAKSRGPKTAEGKAISAKNAVRHGLSAETIILANESPESFQQLLDEYVEELQPVGKCERDLVYRMVVSKWRELRAWNVEAASFNRRTPDLPEGAPAQAPLADAFLSLSETSRSLERLYHYENSITRRFDRAHMRLLELQERRKGIEPRKLVVQWVDSRRSDPSNGPQTAPQTQIIKTNPAPVPNS
jgi:hypothetical protein